MDPYESEETRQYQTDRKAKQQYLQDNVLSIGYD